MTAQRLTRAGVGLFVPARDPELVDPAPPADADAIGPPGRATAARHLLRAGRASLCVLLLLGSAGCAGIARWQEAYSLVSDLAASEAGDPREAAPQPAEVHYRVDGREHVADLYRPSAPARAALVLVHGFTELGKDDPRLRRFAEILADARFLVLVPEIESLTRFNVSTGDIETIRDAVLFMAERTQPADAELGVAAISYSAGPAILAALETAARKHIAFILSIGGYYDLLQSIAFATTGFYREDGGWRYREPATGGRWLLMLGHAHQMPDARDRRLLLRIAERKLDDPQADAAELTARLSDEGLAAYRLVSNRDPGRVPALIARLPAAMQREIAALDLSRYDLSRLRARLILLHGRNDPMIPPSQSEALAAAVPPGQAELFVVGGLAHVDVEPGWRDALELWQAAVSLLKARDGK
jgi:pimeloyl-ACP methyl ester carboxylesterase